MALTKYSDESFFSASGAEKKNRWISLRRAENLVFPPKKE
jgi:hypothetical protein